MAEWYGIPSQLTLSDFESEAFAVLDTVLLVLEDLLLASLLLADLLLADLLLVLAFVESLFTAISSENRGLLRPKPDFPAVFPDAAEFLVPLLEPLFPTDFESLLNRTSSNPFELLLGMLLCW